MSKNFLRTFKFLLFFIVIVIGLGGSVRAMNAGVACPDWPLCFGQVIPDYHPQVYAEFIHRAAAGTMSIFALIMYLFIAFNKKVHRSVKLTGAFALGLLIVQVIIGRLTVLKLLEPGMVSTHLVLGISFLSLLLWMYLSLSESSSALTRESTPSVSHLAVPSWVFYSAIGVLVIIAGQIILGGKVASNYAGLACSVDFPLCNGTLAPTFSGLVGLHVLHRFGAYLSFIAAIGFFCALYFSSVRHTHARIVKLSRMLITLILMQMAIGIANIKFLLPALITVIHTIMAATIVATLVYIIFLSARPSLAK